MTDPQVTFHWVPFFKELALKLKSYESRQVELIAILKQCGISEGLRDLAQEGEFELNEIDPFTFYGYFMKYHLEKRTRYFKELKKIFSLRSEEPKDYNGVPSAQPLNVWMFAYKKDRDPQVIPALWQLFKGLLENITVEPLFDRVLNDKTIFPGIQQAKLSQYIYWLFPDRFLPIDSQTKPYLKNLGIKNEFHSWKEYREILETVKNRIQKPYYEISHEAWINNQPVYQLNQLLFDKYLENYLKNVTQTNWLKFRESYKFRFGRWLSSRVNFDIQSDQQIYEICKDSQKEIFYASGKGKGVNFILTDLRYNDEFIYPQTISVIRKLRGNDLSEEIDISKELIISLPKFSIWASTLIPEQFRALPNSSLLKVLKLLFDLKKYPKHGWKSFVFYQKLLFKIDDEFKAREDSIAACIKDSLDFKELKETDWVWAVQDFLLYIEETILKVIPETPGETGTEVNDGSSVINLSKNNPSYWIYAPGDKAHKWEDFYSEGIMAIGWGSLGNLSQYQSIEEITEKLREVYDTDSSKKNDSNACYDFIRTIKIGDIIIPKRGKKEYLGYGVVTSEYTYEPERGHYVNVRKVDWRKKGVWEEEEGDIVLKTLTDITKYPEYVSKLKSKIGIEITANPPNLGYYWLNANPSVWKITNYIAGQEQTYTTHNEKGNKRRVYKYMQELKPGDLIIGYESTPIRRIVALLEVTQGLYEDDDQGEVFAFKIREFFNNQPGWDELAKDPFIKNAEVFTNNQGSLFSLEKEGFDAILNKTRIAVTPYPSYTVDDLDEDLFLDRSGIKSILKLIKYKKNIILQGPPGTGKTFIAKRLAFASMGNLDESKIEMIQFHQSYAYEDFIQGYRPKEKGGFELKNGVFYEFCNKAQRDSENPYFFIIDEINRGNLSKIFGELMMLIENDKRGEKFAIPLTYSATGDPKFYIPENLHFIGTMNTADRSLALVDYALRRRFSFINIVPEFNRKFEDHLKQNQVPVELINHISSKMSVLNETIEKDSDLGWGYKIGHSFFCNIPEKPDKAWYNLIIENEIKPLLAEYWFDEPDQAKKLTDHLYL